MRLRQLRFRMTSLIFSAVFLIWLYDRSMPISESEATRLAEDFIVRNGYTDLRPDPKIGKLTPEPIVLTSSPEEELESRHDTLARKAEGCPAVPTAGWSSFDTSTVRRIRKPEGPCSWMARVITFTSCTRTLGSLDATSEGSRPWSASRSSVPGSRLNWADSGGRVCPGRKIAGRDRGETWIKTSPWLLYTSGRQPIAEGARS